MLLEGNGYAVLEEGYDTWCLDRAPGDALSELWPGLEPAEPIYGKRN